MCDDEELYESILQQYNIQIGISDDEVRVKKIESSSTQEASQKISQKKKASPKTLPHEDISMREQQERRVLRALPPLPLKVTDHTSFPRLEDAVLENMMNTYLRAMPHEAFSEEIAQETGFVSMCEEEVCRRVSTIAQLMPFAAQFSYTEEGRLYRHRLEDEKKSVKQLVLHSVYQTVVARKISCGQIQEEYYPYVMPMMLQVYLPGTYARYLEAPQHYICLAMYVFQEVARMHRLDMPTVIRDHAEGIISHEHTMLVPEILDICKYIDCIVAHIPRASLAVPDSYFLCSWNDIQKTLPAHPVFTLIDKKMRKKLGTSLACDIRDIFEVFSEVFI